MFSILRQVIYVKVKSVNKIISNKNIIRLLSDSNTNKKVEENVIQVKDMSIHGICFESMKEAFTNFRSYITRRMILLN